MKTYKLFFLILLSTLGVCYSQVTLNNIQTVDTITYDDSSTPSNLNSYHRSEVRNTKEEVSNQVTYWINIGARSQNKDLSIHDSFNFAFKNLSFNVLILGTGRFFGKNSDGYSTRSVTLSAGYSVIERYYLLAFYAGPGLIWGENHKYPNWYSFSKPCISANIQAYFLPLNFLGIGLEFISNQNTEHSLNQLHFSINYIIN